MKIAPISYGIEEEYFLVDPQTRGLVASVPPLFMTACRYRFGDNVQYEMQLPQVEVSTPILYDTATARRELAELRAGVNAIASSMDMSLMAAGTHPMAAWDEQRHTSEARYDQLIDDYQMVGRRNLLSALHVHVSVPDQIDRVMLMNRLMPWLPIFLALSTSSPFWNRQNTGLLSYRQAAYDEWPRSGVPDAFDDETQYESFIELLADCGAVRDGSFLWWAIRPSSRYPTLELRIADCCTRLDDALAIAALFRCLVRAHIRRPTLGLDRTALTRRIVDENRWRAKRYGTQASFIDEKSRRLIGFDQALRSMLKLILPDAEVLHCESELMHAKSISSRGTSAHAQLKIHRQLTAKGLSPEASLEGVVDWLVSATACVDAPASRASTDCATQPGWDVAKA